MKKLPTHYRTKRTAKVACTVSAAALMLGVSHAATVGFNFQANYCSSSGYSGAVVTAPAFGIGTNLWENLAQIPNGYSCPTSTNAVCSYINTNEMITTATSSGGLNPLPNGFLTVTWGAYAANVSGFGGYDESGPNYTFGGNNEKPGNEQVYWGFLRDGVNFGPVPDTCNYSSGDNDQPGYTIDITGLNSLFTNTPFAVQLIASSDSLYNLTNAFVIDATANSTQSVTYPNIPTPANQGGSLNGGGNFPRGIGGGLSTATGPFSTDHLKIIGNRAQHGVGFNNASTICGFILTDKPVISMSPQSVATGPGDTVNFSAYAVGVEPLDYQWLKNGTPIPGATSLSYSVTNVTAAAAGNYALVVTNLYGSATSSVASLVPDRIAIAKGTNFVIDSNTVGPEHDGVDFGATWQASFTDSNSKKRTGVMSFNGKNSNQVTVPAATNFNTTTGTIMFWMLSAGNTNSSPAALFDRETDSGIGVELATSGQLAVSGSVTFETATAVADTNWHHIALVYDSSSVGTTTCYIDGNVDSSTPVGNAAAWSWPSAQEIELGLSQNGAFSAYTGLLDDVRIYNRELTGTEVASVYSSDALVDTTALVLQLNFTTPPTAGATLTWQETDVILQSAPTVHGPWTDVGVAGATQYRVVTKNAAQFFRYRGHQPITIVSNPYLM